MLIITPEEFQKEQNAYLDKVDEGQEVFIRREGGQSYEIVPTDMPTTDIPEEYILEPDEALENAISMEELLARVQKDIHQMFKEKKELV
ncbi:MAG: hypothetical protein LBN24_02655 [Mediterranea sp.]|nr:hypothetical protein [Mediterranea sp.]